MKARILEELLPAVRRNCLISDAQYWGYYSLCGLLLRLRELYRFEQGFDALEPAPQGAVEAWIGERESAWSELAEGVPFEPLALEGNSFDPFDAAGINAHLLSEGLLYGAGYGIYMKPLFFLADLEGDETMDGCRVYTAGREYVRDLSLHPAMLQGDTIVARTHITEVLMAQKYEELRVARRDSALHLAFREYGVEDDLRREQLGTIARTELRTYIHHELGEAAVSRMLDPAWTDLVLSLPHGRPAAFVHDLRDVLSDSIAGGMIDHIIREKKVGSLAFHVVFLSGFRRPLSCRVEEAFRNLGSRGWSVVERARRSVFEQGRGIVERILDKGAGASGDPDAMGRIVLGEANRISPP